LSKEKREKQLKLELIYSSGYAMYSKRFYRIHDIDFSRNPKSLMEDGKTTYC